MCGIVGYIGFKEAFPILLKGLKRLEYRGYDSSGVVLLEEDRLQLFNPHCSSTRRKACIHKAVGLSEFLFVYYRFYFGEGSLLDAKGVKQLL